MIRLGSDILRSQDLDFESLLYSAFNQSFIGQDFNRFDVSQFISGFLFVIHHLFDLRLGGSVNLLRDRFFLAGLRPLFEICLIVFIGFHIHNITPNFQECQGYAILLPDRPAASKAAKVSQGCRSFFIPSSNLTKARMMSEIRSIADS
jgi:hypothetical protein